MKIYNTQHTQLYTVTGTLYIGMWYRDGENYYQYPDIRPGTRTRLYTSEDLNRNTVRSRAQVKISSGVPIPIRPQPSTDDYILGRFLRYFTQKRNAPHLSIVEINKQAYDESLTADRKIGINPALYNSISFPWYISGPREYVMTANTKNTNIVETQFPGISSYLSDPLQFYKPGVDTL